MDGSPPDAFARVVRDPARAALLLDLDGTLAPIVARPEDVRILPDIREVLAVLRDRFGLLAFVSGRAVDELERIVGLRGASYSGNHGVEVRDSSGRSLPVAGLDVAPVHAFASLWSAESLAAQGIWLEDKGGTLTFHYRNAADPAVAAAWLARYVTPEADAAGVVTAPGRMSLEVHPAAPVNKGTAVRTLLEARPDVRRALSIGDDRTDVTVWHELRRLLAEGRLEAALAVGVRSDESPPEVLAEADVLVDGVPGVADVLQRLARCQAP